MCTRVLAVCSVCYNALLCVISQQMSVLDCMWIKEEWPLSQGTVWTGRHTHTPGHAILYPSDWCSTELRKVTRWWKSRIQTLKATNEPWVVYHLFLKSVLYPIVTFAKLILLLCSVQYITLYHLILSYDHFSTMCTVECIGFMEGIGHVRSLTCIPGVYSH